MYSPQSAHRVTLISQIVPRVAENIGQAGKAHSYPGGRWGILFPWKMQGGACNAGGGLRTTRDELTAWVRKAVSYRWSTRHSLGTGAAHDPFGNGVPRWLNAVVPAAHSPMPPEHLGASVISAWKTSPVLVRHGRVEDAPLAEARPAHHTLACFPTCDSAGSRTAISTPTRGTTISSSIGIKAFGWMTDGQRAAVCSQSPSARDRVGRTYRRGTTRFFTVPLLIRIDCASGAGSEQRARDQDAGWGAKKNRAEERRERKSEITPALL